ncbi:hypothetical protein NWE61_05900 [Mycoplasmopsis felis]|uniref:hypothetical protein n=1 Tax=Mycoplasmopsis felis TaxID=33923 RepID=UPI0021E0355A|nr:hypothetical protein [Mycoplasmopsis felis]MCU9934606.1 hypothetical protein [Mycoplasmopsis felis]
MLNISFYISWITCFLWTIWWSKIVIIDGALVLFFNLNLAPKGGLTNTVLFDWYEFKSEPVFGSDKVGSSLLIGLIGSLDVFWVDSCSLLTESSFELFIFFKLISWNSFWLSPASLKNIFKIPSFLSQSYSKSLIFLEKFLGCFRYYMNL